MSCSRPRAICGGRLVNQTALNDIVISRGIASRLIELEVSVDGDPLTRYRCDGLIVSSPTGSTAYSLAAGGAVVFPTADVFALTPICPHTLSNRSLILPLSATIEVKVVSPKPATILSADGQVVSELATGDKITIRRARRTVRLMHLAGSSFCETLRCKLHWRGASLMIRLKDIAQRAGLSIMTVSKALRDEPDVSATTKTRIKLLAQQMGYVPDSTAQGLRTRRTKLFGLVVSSMTNPIYSRVVLAIEERAYALGYDVLLAHTLNIPEREEACLRRLLSRRVDGLFISPVYRMASGGAHLPGVACPPRPYGPARPSPPRFAANLSALSPMTSWPVTPLRSTCSNWDTSALPSWRAPSQRRGPRNGSRAIGGPCGRPAWRWTIGSCFRPAGPSKTAPRRRCR